MQLVVFTPCAIFNRATHLHAKALHIPLPPMFFSATYVPCTRTLRVRRRTALVL